jgi:hypothetical protein
VIIVKNEVGLSFLALLLVTTVNDYFAYFTAARLNIFHVQFRYITVLLSNRRRFSPAFDEPDVRKENPTRKMVIEMRRLT